MNGGISPGGDGWLTACDQLTYKKQLAADLWVLGDFIFGSESMTVAFSIFIMTGR